MKIKRSLINNQFILTATNDDSYKFTPYGNNIDFQAWIRITNNFTETVEIKGLHIFDSTETESIVGLWTNTTLIPQQTVDYKLKTNSLFISRDSLKIPILLSGNLSLIVTTSFHTFSVPIQSICLYNGTLLPNGSYLYAIGKDSTCYEFELENPEGLKASTKGWTEF